MNELKTIDSQNLNHKNDIETTSILKRHKNNPLIHINDYKGVAQIYNPAPAIFGNETILLVSIVEHTGNIGYGRDVGQTWVARSTDGINFKFTKKNFIAAGSNKHPFSL